MSMILRQCALSSCIDMVSPSIGFVSQSHIPALHPPLPTPPLIVAHLSVVTAQCSDSAATAISSLLTLSSLSFPHVSHLFLLTSGPATVCGACAVPSLLYDFTPRLAPDPLSFFLYVIDL